MPLNRGRLRSMWSTEKRATGGREAKACVHSEKGLAVDRERLGRRMRRNLRDEVLTTEDVIGRVAWRVAISQQPAY